MSQNIGTLISASIRPNDSSDLIASAWATDIKGGLHVTDNIIGRDSIIVQRREWGMMCYVVDVDLTYQLKYGHNSYTLTDNLNWVEFSSSSISSVSYTETTHSDLLDLIDSNSLGTASHYLITDYQTVYSPPDYYVDGSSRGSTVSYGSVEPILVMAISSSSLAVDAYQPNWPLDTIKYDVTPQTILDQVSFGTIIERVDQYGLCRCIRS